MQVSGTSKCMYVRMHVSIGDFSAINQRGPVFVVITPYGYKGMEKLVRKGCGAVALR